ncbi:ferredoxin reductase-like protein [Ceraceosorus guamensis]|uniref:NADH-cytochrome b5 reductase n=1 Tax=Ceraceosorus guamensis TaxID=1522189 RepID=A0A316W1V1_9BASI|nr:ferredoxin reductase-like protein [Ceraceosorus guamensis]PWN43068.1 ferredoxin reductase-like protein [Ceraceosorus guamensis]
MNEELLLLYSSLALTFLTLLAAVHLLASFTSYPPLVALAEATNIMDPNAIIAFAVGLVASVGFLVFINSGKAKPVLNPTEWQTFKLTEKRQLSENTALYRFRLPSDNSILGLPIGQHVSVQANINGKNVMRSYTPVSSDDDRGFFDLLIKTYDKGNISKHVSTLKIGDGLEVRGPKGQMRYSNGLVRHLGMLAGGTGITPMLQIIRAIAKDPQDKTEVDLIYANVSEADILCRKELDDLAAKNKQFRVHYFLNNPPEGWKGGEGFVTKEAINDNFPTPAEDIKILLCGPPPMINAMKKHLEELKYDPPKPVSKLPDQVFSF